MPNYETVLDIKIRVRRADIDASDKAHIEATGRLRQELEDLLIQRYNAQHVEVVIKPRLVRSA